MKQIHIQEFRALLQRATRILAETHCGAVEVTKQAALDWAEDHSSAARNCLPDELPCFWEMPPHCLVIGSAQSFSLSIRIMKQRGTNDL